MTPPCSMIYGSVCSGIEAASVAWHPLGWNAAWFSEIEKFPSSVLAHHYPGIPNLGDMTRLHEKEEYRTRAIDLLVGGTPCQSFSIAGLRKGLEDSRGNLAITFCQIAHNKRPRWVVWENVPGVLSDKGNAFGCFLAGLSGAGSELRPGVEGWSSAGVVSGPMYGLAWRVLDAQYFGVPQRRRRVFVVGHLGDWRPAVQVLFEPGGVSRDLETGGEAGEGTAAATESGAGGGSVARALRARANASHREDSDNYIAHALNAKGGSGRQDGESETFIAHTLKAEHDASEDGTGRGVPLVPAPTPIQEVGKRTGKSTNDRQNGIGIGKAGDPMFTLQAGAQHGIIAAHETGQGFWKEDDKAGTIRAEGENRPSRPSNIIAFGSKDHGQDALQDVSPTLRSGNEDKGHANAGVPPAVCYDMRGNGGDDKAPNITGDHAGRPTDYTPIIFEPRFARNGRGAPEKICPPLKAQSGKTGKGDSAPVVFSIMPQNSGKDFKAREVEVTQPLMAGGPTTSNQGGDLVVDKVPTEPACFQQNSRSEVRNMGGKTGAVTSEPGAQCQNYVAFVQDSQSGVRELRQNMAVRRLTPRECERLQGFPDDYTLIPLSIRNKKAEKKELIQFAMRTHQDPEKWKWSADGPRYKALGNSMAVPCMAWIGKRIQMVSEMITPTPQG